MEDYLFIGGPYDGKVLSVVGEISMVTLPDQISGLGRANYFGIRCITDGYEDKVYMYAGLLLPEANRLLDKWLAERQRIRAERVKAEG